MLMKHRNTLDLLIEVLDTTKDIKERATKMAKILEDKRTAQMRNVHKQLNDLNNDVSFIKGQLTEVTRTLEKCNGMCNALWYFMKESQRSGRIAAWSQPAALRY